MWRIDQSAYQRFKLARCRLRPRGFPTEPRVSFLHLDDLISVERHENIFAWRGAEDPVLVFETVFGLSRFVLRVSQRQQHLIAIPPFDHSFFFNSLSNRRRQSLRIYLGGRMFFEIEQR